MSSVTRRVIVAVTQEDIDNGDPGMCYDCPVATALTRAVGRRCRVKEPTRWGFSDGMTGDKRDSIVDPYRLPPSAATFVEVFDDFGRDHVFPFSFEIEVPV